MTVQAAPVKLCGSAAGFVHTSARIAVAAIAWAANGIADQSAGKSASRSADQGGTRVPANRLACKRANACADHSALLGAGAARNAQRHDSRQCRKFESLHVLISS
jgi:hypothetical protein